MAPRGALVPDVKLFLQCRSSSMHGGGVWSTFSVCPGADLKQVLLECHITLPDGREAALGGTGGAQGTVFGRGDMATMQYADRVSRWGPLPPASRLATGPPHLCTDLAGHG